MENIPSHILGLWILLSITAIVCMWVFTSDKTYNIIVTAILGCSAFLVASTLLSRYNKDNKNSIPVLESIPEALAEDKTEALDREKAVFLNPKIIEQYNKIGNDITNYPIEEQKKLYVSVWHVDFIKDAMRAQNLNDRKLHTIAAINMYRLVHYIRYGLQTDNDYDLLKPLSVKEQSTVNELWNNHPDYKTLMNHINDPLNYIGTRATREIIDYTSLYIPMMCNMKSILQ